MIRTTSTPDGAPSGRRLAAGAAGAVLALTALIAVPAAGALGTGAAGARPAATATTTPPYPTCGAGGDIQPFCTRPPTTSITTTSRTTPPVPCGGSAEGGVKPFCTHPPTTSPTGTAPVRIGLIDFEDGDLRAWTTTVPQVRLKVTKAARQAGRYGLRISNLYRGPVATGTSSTVNAYLTDSRFAGTGELRKVTLQLRPSKVTALPSSSCGRPITRANSQVVVTLTSGSVRATTTVALTSTSWTTVTLVVPAPAREGENVMLGLSHAGSPTKAPLYVDSITLDRVSAPTGTPTASPTATATSAAAPAAVVHPLCTTK